MNLPFHLRDLLSGWGGSSVNLEPFEQGSAATVSSSHHNSPVDHHISNSSSGVTAAARRATAVGSTAKPGLRESAGAVSSPQSTTPRQMEKRSADSRDVPSSGRRTQPRMEDTAVAPGPPSVQHSSIGTETHRRIPHREGVFRTHQQTDGAGYFKEETEKKKEAITPLVCSYDIVQRPLTIVARNSNTQSGCRLKLEEGPQCADYHPDFRILVVGGAREIQLVQVQPALGHGLPLAASHTIYRPFPQREDIPKGKSKSSKSTDGGNTESNNKGNSNSSNTSTANEAESDHVPQPLENMNAKFKVAKVESIAWYPSDTEATFAFTDSLPTVTILMDVLEFRQSTDHVTVGVKEDALLMNESANAASPPSSTTGSRKGTLSNKKEDVGGVAMETLSAPLNERNGNSKDPIIPTACSSTSKKRSLTASSSPPRHQPRGSSITRASVSGANSSTNNTAIPTSSPKASATPQTLFSNSTNARRRQAAAAAAGRKGPPPGASKNFPPSTQPHHTASPSVGNETNARRGNEKKDASPSSASGADDQRGSNADAEKTIKIKAVGRTPRFTSFISVPITQCLSRPYPYAKNRKKLCAAHEVGETKGVSLHPSPLHYNRAFTTPGSGGENENSSCGPTTRNSKSGLVHQHHHPAQPHSPCSTASSPEFEIRCWEPVPRQLMEFTIPIKGHPKKTKVVWDPHHPYTLAVTSALTYFELWEIPMEFVSKEESVKLAMQMLLTKTINTMKTKQKSASKSAMNIQTQNHENEAKNEFISGGSQSKSADDHFSTEEAAIEAAKKSLSEEEHEDFEKLVDKFVYMRMFPPRLVLRPPLSSSGTSSRNLVPQDLVFSPSHPHWILVLCEASNNSGEVRIFDTQRLHHGGAPALVSIQGMCLSISFHPLFRDVLAVSYRVARSTTACTVEFWEVLLPQSEKGETKTAQHKCRSGQIGIETGAEMPKTTLIGRKPCTQEESFGLPTGTVEPPSTSTSSSWSEYRHTPIPPVEDATSLSPPPTASHSLCPAEEGGVDWIHLESSSEVTSEMPRTATVNESRSSSCSILTTTTVSPTHHLSQALQPLSSSAAPPGIGRGRRQEETAVRTPTLRRDFLPPIVCYACFAQFRWRPLSLPGITSSSAVRRRRGKRAMESLRQQMAALKAPAGSSPTDGGGPCRSAEYSPGVEGGTPHHRASPPSRSMQVPSLLTKQEFLLSHLWFATSFTDSNRSVWIWDALYRYAPLFTLNFTLIESAPQPRQPALAISSNGTGPSSRLGSGVFTPSAAGQASSGEGAMKPLNGVSPALSTPTLNAAGVGMLPPSGGVRKREIDAVPVDVVWVDHWSVVAVYRSGMVVLSSLISDNPFALQESSLQEEEQREQSMTVSSPTAAKSTWRSESAPRALTPTAVAAAGRSKQYPGMALYRFLLSTVVPTSPSMNNASVPSSFMQKQTNYHTTRSVTFQPHNANSTFAMGGTTTTPPPIQAIETTVPMREAQISVAPLLSLVHHLQTAERSFGCTGIPRHTISFSPLAHFPITTIHALSFDRFVVLQCPSLLQDATTSSSERHLFHGTEVNAETPAEEPSPLLLQFGSHLEGLKNYYARVLHHGVGLLISQHFEKELPPFSFLEGLQPLSLDQSLPFRNPGSSRCELPSPMWWVRQYNGPSGGASGATSHDASTKPPTLNSAERLAPQSPSLGHTTPSLPNGDLDDSLSVRWCTRPFLPSSSRQGEERTKSLFLLLGPVLHDMKARERRMDAWVAHQQEEHHFHGASPPELSTASHNAAPPASECPVPLSHTTLFTRLGEAQPCILFGVYQSQTTALLPSPISVLSSPFLKSVSRIVPLQRTVRWTSLQRLRITLAACLSARRFGEPHHLNRSLENAMNRRFEDERFLVFATEWDMGYGAALQLQHLRSTLQEMEKLKMQQAAAASDNPKGESPLGSPLGNGSFHSIPLSFTGEPQGTSSQKYPSLSVSRQELPVERDTQPITAAEEGAAALQTCHLPPANASTAWCQARKKEHRIRAQKKAERRQMEEAIDLYMAHCMKHNAEVCREQSAADTQNFYHSLSTAMMMLIAEEQQTPHLREHHQHVRDDLRGAERHPIALPKEGRIPSHSLPTEEDVRHLVEEHLTERARDGREQWWRAAVHAWCTHSPSIILTVTVSQLEHASLLGDTQFCITLYQLYCLWWKLRRGLETCAVYSAQPFVHIEDDEANSLNDPVNITAFDGTVSCPLLPTPIANAASELRSTREEADAVKPDFSSPLHSHHRGAERHAVEAAANEKYNEATPSVPQQPSGPSASSAGKSLPLCEARGTLGPSMMLSKWIPVPSVSTQPPIVSSSTSTVLHTYMDPNSTTAGYLQSRSPTTVQSHHVAGEVKHILFTSLPRAAPAEASHDASPMRLQTGAALLRTASRAPPHARSGTSTGSERTGEAAPLPESTRNPPACTPEEWKHRALQWLDHYATQLQSADLFVPVNELYLITQETFGRDNPILFASQSAYEKQRTYVFCEGCEGHAAAHNPGIAADGSVTSLPSNGTSSSDTSPTSGKGVGGPPGPFNHTSSVAHTHNTNLVGVQKSNSTAVKTSVADPPLKPFKEAIQRHFIAEGGMQVADDSTSTALRQVIAYALRRVKETTLPAPKVGAVNEALVPENTTAPPEKKGSGHHQTSTRLLHQTYAPLQSSSQSSQSASPIASEIFSGAPLNVIPRTPGKTEQHAQHDSHRVAHPPQIWKKKRHHPRNSQRRRHCAAATTSASSSVSSYDNSNVVNSTEEEFQQRGKRQPRHRRRYSSSTTSASGGSTNSFSYSDTEDSYTSSSNVTRSSAHRHHRRQESLLSSSWSTMSFNSSSSSSYSFSESTSFTTSSSTEQKVLQGSRRHKMSHTHRSPVKKSGTRRSIKPSQKCRREGNEEAAVSRAAAAPFFAAVWALRRQFSRHPHDANEGNNEEVEEGRPASFVGRRGATPPLSPPEGGRARKFWISPFIPAVYSAMGFGRWKAADLERRRRERLLHHVVSHRSNSPTRGGKGSSNSRQYQKANRHGHCRSASHSRRVPGVAHLASTSARCYFSSSLLSFRHGPRQGGENYSRKERPAVGNLAAHKGSMPRNYSSSSFHFYSHSSSSPLFSRRYPPSSSSTAGAARQRGQGLGVGAFHGQPYRRVVTRAIDRHGGGPPLPPSSSTQRDVSLNRGGGRGSAGEPRGNEYYTALDVHGGVCSSLSFSRTATETTRGQYPASHHSRKPQRRPLRRRYAPSWTEKGTENVDNVSIPASKNTSSTTIPNSALPNATCVACGNYRQRMTTCVICESVVEGVFVRFPECSHGGHPQHIRAWLEVSDACPSCGAPVHQSATVTAVEEELEALLFPF